MFEEWTICWKSLCYTMDEKPHQLEYTTCKRNFKPLLNCHPKLIKKLNSNTCIQNNEKLCSSAPCDRIHLYTKDTIDFIRNLCYSTKEFYFIDQQQYCQISFKIFIFPDSLLILNTSNLDYWHLHKMICLSTISFSKHSSLVLFAVLNLLKIMQEHH